MAKLISPLSDLKIKNAKPAAKQYTLFDGGGLHVLVQPTGTKTFRLKANINGKDRRITLGKYPTLDLAGARALARDYQQKIQAGIDPVGACEHTVKSATESFIDWQEKGGRAPATIRKYRECLANNIAPAIGDISIAELDTITAVKFIEKIAAKTPSLAYKCKELISMTVRRSIQRGWRPQFTNLDLTGILHKPQPKKKKMISVEDFMEITLPKIENQNSILMVCAMKLQFLCFLRSSETMGGKWSEINFIEAQWVVEADRMKMKRPHVVPLSIQSIEILKQLKELTGWSEYLFPSMLKSEGNLHRDALSKSFRDHLLGIHPHGCRTLASTWMRNNGFSPEWVEAQLSHIEANQIAAAYIDCPHLMYLEQRAKMMQAWANALMPPSGECKPASRKRASGKPGQA